MFHMTPNEFDFEMNAVGKAHVRIGGRERAVDLKPHNLSNAATHMMRELRLWAALARGSCQVHAQIPQAPQYFGRGISIAAKLPRAILPLRSESLPRVRKRVIYKVLAADYGQILSKSLACCFE
jgi:hypothetical protein